MRHPLFPFLLCLGLLLTACDPETTHSFALRNATDTTAIHVQASYSPLGPFDTIVQPGEQISLGVLAYMGVEDSPQNVSTFFDSLLIISALGDTCTRDPLQDASWNIQTKEVGRRPTTYQHDYEMIIIEGDFL